MRKAAVFFLALLFIAGPAYAGPDRVRLKNGKVLDGAVLFWNGGQLNFDSDDNGLMVISSSDLEEIHLAPRVVPRDTPAPSPAA